MLKPFLALSLGCGIWLAECAAARAAADDLREKIKREAWDLAVAAVAAGQRGDLANSPGWRAFLGDFSQAESHAKEAPAGLFSPPDSDALVTRNPHFWAACFELHPGDAIFSLLHAAILLSAGEAQRATVVAATGLQCHPLAEDTRRALLAIIASAQSVQAHSSALVQEGVQAADARNYVRALNCFAVALEDWPGNGWAHYERASALRLQALAEGARTHPGPLVQSASDPPETQRELAEARRHDPLQLLAYQGDDPATVPSLLALVQQGIPVWEGMRRHPEQPVRADHLENFAEACRVARIDEYALALRQAGIQHGARYRPEDQAFISDCLSRLAPAAARATLARLAEDSRFPALRLGPLGSLPAASPATPGPAPLNSGPTTPAQAAASPGSKLAEAPAKDQSRPPAAAIAPSRGPISPAPLPKKKPKREAAEAEPVPKEKRHSHNPSPKSAHDSESDDEESPRKSGAKHRAPKE